MALRPRYWYVILFATFLLIVSSLTLYDLFTFYPRRAKSFQAYENYYDLFNVSITIYENYVVVEQTIVYKSHNMSIIQIPVINTNYIISTPVYLLSKKRYRVYPKEFVAIIETKDLSKNFTYETYYLDYFTVHVNASICYIKMNYFLYDFVKEAFLSKIIDTVFKIDGPVKKFRLQYQSYLRVVSLDHFSQLTLYPYVQTFFKKINDYAAYAEVYFVPPRTVASLTLSWNTINLLIGPLYPSIPQILSGIVFLLLVDFMIFLTSILTMRLSEGFKSVTIEPLHMSFILIYLLTNIHFIVMYVIPVYLFGSIALWTLSPLMLLTNFSGYWVWSILYPSILIAISNFIHVRSHENPLRIITLRKYFTYAMNDSELLILNALFQIVVLHFMLTIFCPISNIYRSEIAGIRSVLFYHNYLLDIRYVIVVVFFLLVSSIQIIRKLCRLVNLEEEITKIWILKHGKSFTKGEQIFIRVKTSEILRNLNKRGYEVNENSLKFLIKNIFGKYNVDILENYVLLPATQVPVKYVINWQELSLEKQYKSKIDSMKEKFQALKLPTEFNA